MQESKAQKTKGKTRSAHDELDRYADPGYYYILLFALQDLKFEEDKLCAVQECKEDMITAAKNGIKVPEECYELIEDAIAKSSLQKEGANAQS